MEERNTTMHAGNASSNAVLLYTEPEVKQIQKSLRNYIDYNSEVKSNK